MRAGSSEEALAPAVLSQLDVALSPSFPSLWIISHLPEPLVHLPGEQQVPNDLLIDLALVLVLPGNEGIHHPVRQLTLQLGHVTPGWEIKGAGKGGGEGKAS